MFDRIYVEIGNICNMSCSFCAGTKRAPKRMSAREFEEVCKKLFGFGENLYFHVMGEPLLHPELDKFLKIAKAYGYKVSITTNGTLLKKAEPILFENADAIHRVSVSLHAPEGNGIYALDTYLDSAFSFAKEFSAIDKNVVFSLLPPIPPCIRVFSSESTLCMRWPKYWSFSFSISPSNEHPGLISFGWTGWISLQSKGLSRVFSITTV